MMKLSTMLKVAKTVDSKWRSPLAEEILKHWEYDEGSVYALRYSANFVFVFKKNEKTYFLRFNDSSEKDLPSLNEEMKILNRLGDGGIPVVKPVLSMNGKAVEQIETDLGIFYASVFEALPGKQYETEELELSQFFIWGSSLGKLHEAMKKWNDNQPYKRMSWKEQLTAVMNLIPDHEAAAKTEAAELLRWAEQLPMTKKNFGLIHYDFELDNLRWQDGAISILDFDDCMYHWYVADIAFALRDLDKRDRNNPLFAEFLKGYQSETCVDQELLRQMPIFSRLHDLTMFVKLLKAVDLPESSNDPEWLINLRTRLFGRMETYRMSFCHKTTERM